MRLGALLILAAIIMVAIFGFGLFRDQLPQAGIGGGPQENQQQDQTQVDRQVNQNILSALENDGSYTIFLQAMEAVGLTSTLTEPGPYTVFAPTDDAFTKMSLDEIRALAQNRQQLEDILNSHIVRGKITSDDLSTMTTLRTLQGGSISVENRDGLRVGGAGLVESINSDNGIIHGVDTVLSR